MIGSPVCRFICSVQWSDWKLRLQEVPQHSNIASLPTLVCQVRAMVSCDAPTEPSSQWPLTPHLFHTTAMPESVTKQESDCSDASSDYSTGTPNLGKSQGRDLRNAKMAHAKLCGVDLRSVLEAAFADQVKNLCPHLSVAKKCRLLI